MQNPAVALCLMLLAVPAMAQLFVGLEDASLPVRSTDLAGFPAVDWTDHAPFEVNGMAASPDGVLYICNGPFTTHLHRYDPAGGSTDLGTLSVDIHGLGYGNGVLYGFSNFTSPMGIYSIDTDTGVATLAVDTSGPGYRYFGLDYNPQDGLLYGYTEYGSPAGLHSIDPATGTITPVAGSIPAENSQGRGLAVGNGVVFIAATRGDDGIALYAWDLAADGPWTPFTQPFPLHHNTGGAAFVAPPGPRCEVLPTLIEGGRMLAGGSRSAQFTVSNLGQGVLTGSAVACPGATVQNGSWSLSAGQSQQVGLTVEYTGAGDHECQVDLGHECDPVVHRISVVQVQPLTGPASACGVVLDPGHGEGAVSGFIPDWNNGLVGLELANGLGNTLALQVMINGQAVWSGNVDADRWEARETFLDLAPWFDQDIRLWFEVSDGVDVWNEDGSECAWELAFSGVEPRALPSSPVLGSPWPNPFNPTTRITVGQAASAPLVLTVVDLTGRPVAVLHRGLLPAGEHTFDWRPGNQASGLYLLVLESGSHRETRRLLYLK